MKRYAFFLIPVIAVLCFWAAAATHRSFMHERTMHRADYAPPVENMSPLMAFTTIALGGFRGIIADMLWVRGMELQAQGRFFELAQLADWITKLEPNFVSVWAFHSWNMAYNISNLFPDPEDRWRWVQHGIHLIRDEGLQLNPRHPELYWELAWLYQHKVGYVMDFAHWHYKIKLASDMQKFMGGRGPECSDPEMERQLREKYKLYPEIMRAVNERYGPLDWRHPATHALYWAYRGMRLVPDKDITALTPAVRRAAFNCEKTILQSISLLVRQGNLFVDPGAGLFVTSPMFELLPYAAASYEEALTRYDVTVFHKGYVNLLANAAFMLYCYGREEEARDLFAVLLSKYKAEDPDFDFSKFIEEGMNQDFSEMDRDIAMAMVEGALFQSCLQEAKGQHENAAAFERDAKRVWSAFMNSRLNDDHRRRTGLAPLAVIQNSARERAGRALPQPPQEGSEE